MNNLQLLPADARAEDQAAHLAELMRLHLNVREAVMLAANPCQSCHSRAGTMHLHGCPSAADINRDDSDICNCCDDCIAKCLDEV